MSGSKEGSPMKNPTEWLLRASLSLLGAVIALNLAVAYLQPVLPWIVGGLAAAAMAWLVVTLVRWRRSKW